MDQNKRIWIYCGLATAAGVGLVVAVAKSSKAQALPQPQAAQNGSANGPVAPPATPQALFRPIQAGDRLLLVGDSLAAGLAAPMQQLASDAQIAFRGDGRVSTTIAQWAQQPWLATDLASVHPTIVVVSLGTNDMKLNQPSAEQKALDALVQTLRATTATLVWLMPPTMPFPDKGVRAMIDGEGVVEFPSDSLTIPRGPDGIHPTAAGYAGWAGSVWQFLLRGGASTRRRPPPQRRTVVR